MTQRLAVATLSEPFDKAAVPIAIRSRATPARKLGVLCSQPLPTSEFYLFH
jgi:hypothetical protein